MSTILPVADGRAVRRYALRLLRRHPRLITAALGLQVLAADPEVLVLVEPTSAVDAHTEARIAERLRRSRAGRTTVVTTTSPLLLDVVDEVAFLSGGRVVATGRHDELLAQQHGYRWVVTRETDLQPSEALR